MIATGYQILAGQAPLWSLATACQPLLGPVDSLMAMGEGPLGSLLGPWAGFPQQDGWTQGRLFGSAGELRWRAYGPLVRAVLIVDVTAPESEQRLAYLKALAFEGAQTLPLTPRDQELFLWRSDPYVRGACRLYLDDSGQKQFVRYVKVW